MSKRHIALSIVGFVQQVAVSHLRSGYFFYVAGAIPAHKSGSEVDSKLTEQYLAEVSKHVRYRRSLRGEASVRYIRHGHFFLLMANHGKHEFFEYEKVRIRDARRTPIKAFGYSMGVRSGKVSVRIEQNEYRFLLAKFTRMALGNKGLLESQLWALPYEPYRPVRGQLLTLWRAINRKRKLAGLPPLSKSCVRWKRRIVKPFEE